MNFLIASNNVSFLDEATSIVETELLQIDKIQDVLNQNSLLQKIAQNDYEYILIDLNSCPVDIPFFEKLCKLTKTKVKIACQNHADIPNDFFYQKSIQIASMDYSLLAHELKKLILNNADFLWPGEITKFTLYKKEALFHKDSIGDAIYLVKEGSLQRTLPDGTILDDSIGPGKLAGELTYFNRKPRQWKIIAIKNCTLVRIAYSKIDKQLEGQPSWIMLMFKTLAERSLKYVNPITK